MNGFGISCVVVILLVVLLSAGGLMSGAGAGIRQEQVGGITGTGI